ncbi:DUF3267 domain-containing protein [Pontibacter sp. KCTC 32443]|uniref:DUF3267 domain-containing protein n=1 Tax=Pontibacter TaxID=323449 RepID=UPI00164D5885|nr:MULTISPECIES: DUF3267 domain-containing protein [Pontibacter]MBC5775148.1 DUF3267 domain-containing protein [Pontibacter sp. KCTC 32443]
MINQIEDSSKYTKQELTVSAAKANVLALFFILPLLLIFIPAYVWLWPEQFEFQNIKSFYGEHKLTMLLYPLFIFLIMIPGAVVHELLHGFTWAAFCKNGLKSIKYGVHWKMLTPYCHCKEVLPLRPYILGGMMPGLVMGVLPTIAGLILGSINVFLFGLLFTIAAGGDMLILWMLRHTSKHDLVQDHPELIGCIVYRKV